MNNVNKTLYIPLYGKAMVSKQGIILQDPQAEMIWEAEGFELKGKARSKWLCYDMGMRSAVFDRWLREKMAADEKAVVLHIGCGMDSRILRVGERGHVWYDVDFPAVIEERKKYFSETQGYHMLSQDARDPQWLRTLEGGARAIVVMEGVSMYMDVGQLRRLFEALEERFSHVSLLADFYTVFAARASKYKNPINEVGVTELCGVDDPRSLEGRRLKYAWEHELTPADLIDQLQGWEHSFFKLVFGGRITKKIYRLYEFDG